LIVVGTFLPQIEIWNLDSENCEPVATLGNLPEDRKKSKKAKVPDTADSHTDAVMSISLNPY
jgi:hypothetical protein